MKQRVLIIGLGISGMSAAIALEAQGWSPILIERAPTRRKGGYFIGLRNEGKNAARELGIFDTMEKRTPERLRFWDIRKDGSRRRVADLTRETDAPVAVMRGDIEDVLWQAVESRMDIRFDTVPVAIESLPDGVNVSLRHGEEETQEHFDLVIGADGVRSAVRRMVFGPDKSCLHPLGTTLCAFPLSRPVPHCASGDGVMIADTGRTLTIFPLQGKPSTALFSYRQSVQYAAPNEAPLQALQRRFAGLDVHGIVSSALSDLAATNDFLFDSVQMVKIPRWSKGRVVLLGDSAWCLTLYSGMGASAGMMGGLALAKALAAHPDNLDRGLAAFETEMRPFIRRHQRFVRLRAELFVPSTWISLKARRLLWRIMRWSQSRKQRDLSASA
ncbi:FAD-dependent monooxygenase [Asaia prunellae]|uniref:FAD-dependent monooxygenase n=1 Tax=Asaia prunellae TaxID=610245 RepID=UPI0004727112|nr:FAD-dependent monooxygenase [Asaia prunellae]